MMKMDYRDPPFLSDCLILSPGRGGVKRFLLILPDLLNLGARGEGEGVGVGGFDAGADFPVGGHGDHGGVVAGEGNWRERQFWLFVAAVLAPVVTGLGSYRLAVACAMRRES